MATATRHGRRPWLPWLILAISLTLVTYSVDSFLRLPQQLSISQQCRMSRMWPAYIDHTANLEPFSSSGLWRKYRLYLYRERYFEPMDLPTGSPALFVPGNSGSYGQVRSVASSASRQFYKENGSGERRDEWKDAPPGVTHTDWYTIDFNEDFSAFSGSTLIEQATFINEVVAYLSNRYESPATHSFAAGERNTTVPILAHSMGGIAARLAQRLPNHPAGYIDTIVTLSTPHAYPPVPFDRSVEHVYSLINSPVEPSKGMGGAITNVPPLMVSIAGGLLDTQLPSDPSSLSLSRIGESVAASRISTYTGSLPSLWSSVDHLAVMWCDQLREKIARGFLLDMMAFGRVSNDRNAGGVSGRSSILRRRRELWRRALSLFDVSDAGNGEVGPLELISAPDTLTDDDYIEPFVVDKEVPTFPRPTTGPDSALSVDQQNIVFRIPAKLGVADDDLHAFELITNLCVGWNPSSGNGAPIPQPVELVVQMCSNSPNPSDPVGEQKTWCQLVMPWQWELIPPSFLPRTDVLMQESSGRIDATLPENKPFPSAEEIYHVPGYAFQRLRLDAKLLKRQQVDWIRVERKTDSGIFVHQRGLKSFVRGGWMRQAAGRIEEHGSSLLLTTDQDSAEQQHHQDAGFATTSAIPLASEWVLKRFGSSLLARRIQVVPSQCLIENLATYSLLTNDESLHSTDASFSPFLHVSDRSTGDSRWYPQLASPELIRKIRAGTYKGESITFPLSLHGNAPFMPPARDSVDEIRVQLWSDQALLRSVPGKSLVCRSPIDSIRLSVDWKASAGLVLLRYRFFLAAWPLGLLTISIGLSWLSWATNPGLAFPSPLTSITQPAFRTPFTAGKGDPLLGLLACLTAALLLVDSIRLALYRSMPSPNSSLLGMVLGLHSLSSSAGLVPCFLLVSYATVLIIVAAVQWSFVLVAAAVTKFGLARKLDWVGAATASSDPLRWNRQSMAGLAILLLSVVLFVPHQFIFLCMFLLQLLNTLRALLELRSQKAAPHSLETHFHQHLSVFTTMALLLPQKASFLVTWVRNLASVGIKTPKTIAAWMDHNILDVAPIVVLVWLMAGGRMLEPPRTGVEAKAIAMGFGVVGWYALVWGIRYTYSIYDAFNVLCVLLAFCHWRSRRAGSHGQHRHDPLVRHGNKHSDETLGMMDDRGDREDGPSKKGPAGTEEYELQGTSGSTQLPIHHLALPASISAQSADSPPTKAKAESLSGDKLDKLIAEYLDVLDQYQQLRAATTKLFSSGYLKLSRAKMEYGASRLGSNSYDSRLLAEVRATVEQSSSNQVSVARVQPDYSHLDEESGVLIGGDSDENTVEKEDIAATGLRRRAGHDIGGTGGKLGEPDAAKSLPRSSRPPSSPSPAKMHAVDSAAPGKKPAARPNALLQFGGLPTTSLRGAQGDLRQALDQALGVGPNGHGLVQLALRLEKLAQAIAELKAVEFL
ncbi:related to BST1-negative regulator of COPII vesicle formation [Sporisorium reilianum f. sp. reilianum]|uniref:GPI inositol-deacylase n=1 Tax=Sporisorium reilianum f. sp. reilianum TaxID=72559 RepID=A0A2N8UHP1_9BASI|nr:related to BST1-negative regulator of COPII vesicle formation [Sporisorium reilianum f. sp. reilianum]